MPPNQGFSSIDKKRHSINLDIYLFFNLFLAWIIFTDTLQLITYSDLSGKLREFPHDIPSDVEKIEIKKSKIRTIDYIEVFPSLRTFGFTTNAFGRVP